MVIGQQVLLIGKVQFLEVEFMVLVERSEYSSSIDKRSIYIKRSSKTFVKRNLNNFGI